MSLQDRPLSRVWSVLRPRRSRAQVAIALLCCLLGFGLATQVQAQHRDPLSSASETDLLGILDRTRVQIDRTRDDTVQKQIDLDRISSQDSSQAALEEARRRASVMAILTGTAPATGPGIVLVIRDPDHAVRAADLLDTLEELRDAGAEAAQIDGSSLDGRLDAGPAVRLVASSYFVDGDPGTVVVNGTPLTPPYTLRVIGDAHTLATALQIPGGVLERLHSLGASGTVTEPSSVSVSAVRAVSRPRYAQPVPTASPDK